MKSKCNMCTVAPLIGALLLSTGAMASLPQEGTVEMQSERVMYSAVHAAEAAGAAELYAKLRRAARRACGKLWNERITLENGAAEARCVNDAIGNAVAGINIPTVTALHMQGRKTGKVEATMVAKQ